MHRGLLWQCREGNAASVNDTPGIIPCASSHHDDIIMGGARGQSHPIFFMDPPSLFQSY